MQVTFISGQDSLRREETPGHHLILLLPALISAICVLADDWPWLLPRIALVYTG